MFRLFLYKFKTKRSILQNIQVKLRFIHKKIIHIKNNRFRYNIQSIKMVRNYIVNSIRNLNSTFNIKSLFDKSTQTLCYLIFHFPVINKQKTKKYV